MCKRNRIAALLLGGMLAAGTVFPGPGAGEVLVVHAAEDAFSLEEQEYQILLRIVEAEAGGEDITGKMLVAGVVMNRVTSEAFPAR